MNSNGDNNSELDISFSDHTVTPSGIRCRVCFKVGDKEYRDLVNISVSKNRKAFAKECIERFFPHLSPLEQENNLRLIEDILLKEELRVYREDQTEPRPQTKALSESERKEALDFLADPNLILRIQEDLTKIGAAGQDRQKVLVYLIGTSRKMPTGLAGIIKGSSSVGKNHLLKTVLSLMPEEDIKDYSRISAQALYYGPKDFVKHKILVVDEAVGKEQAEFAIRVFQSEGRLKAMVADRPREGAPLESREPTVEGPIAYFETTTKFEIHHENATRAFEIYLDESEEQTHVIHQIQAVEDTEAFYELKVEREAIQRVHRNAQRLLQQGIDVRMPFSPLIKFPTDSVRARRDRPKLMALVKIIAFLHQYQREIKRAPNGQPYILATPFDYAIAYGIAKETFVETTDDLDKRSREVLEVAIRQVKELRSRGGNGSGLAVDPTFTRSDIETWMKKHKRHLIGAFQELEEKEYFLNESGDPVPASKRSSTQRRVYRINWTLAEAGGSFDGLSTPDELYEALKAAPNHNLSESEVFEEKSVS